MSEFANSCFVTSCVFTFFSCLSPTMLWTSIFYFHQTPSSLKAKLPTNIESKILTHLKLKHRNKVVSQEDSRALYPLLCAFGGSVYHFLQPPAVRNVRLLKPRSVNKALSGSWDCTGTRQMRSSVSSCSKSSDLFCDVIVCVCLCMYVCICVFLSLFVWTCLKCVCAHTCTCVCVFFSL